MENSFLTILLIAVGVILMLMLLGAFKKSGGSSGFRRNQQSQQGLMGGTGGSGYAFSSIWQDGSDSNDCCTNCYMCYNRKAEVIGPNGNVIGCQSVNGRPAYKCPDPDGCAAGCECEYKIDCASDSGDNGQCIDKIVRDSTFNDCDETCEEQHESDKYGYGCVLSDSDLDQCLSKCCSAGKSWDPDCY